MAAPGWRSLACALLAACTASPDAPPAGPTQAPREGDDLSAAPPFTLSDIRNAIPAHCWERNAAKSFAYLARDVAIVMGLAATAAAINSW